jgi:uncharacterized protein
MSELKDDFDIKEIYNIIPKKIIKEILTEFPLNIRESFDGINHIARVIENGIILSEINRSKLNVIIVYAFFHNIKKKSNEQDKNHAERSANFLRNYEKELNITEEEFDMVYEACKNHSDELFNENKNIADCWDADRLDIMRKGLYPNKEKMNSSAAKNPGIITWAMKRSLNDYQPIWVEELLKDIGV